MDGFQQIDFDQQILAISAATPKTPQHRAFERQLAELEAEIEAHRATAGKEVAENREDRAGAARKLANAALTRHGQVMNQAKPAREDFYERRALALEPVRQRIIDYVARTLEAAPSSMEWREIVLQLKAAADAHNRIGRSQGLWGPRARLSIDLTDEDRTRGFISRHRSA